MNVNWLPQWFAIGKPRDANDGNDMLRYLHQSVLDVDLFVVDRNFPAPVCRVYACLHAFGFKTQPRAMCCFNAQQEWTVDDIYGIKGQFEPDDDDDDDFRIQ